MLLFYNQYLFSQLLYFLPEGTSYRNLYNFPSWSGIDELSINFSKDKFAMIFMFPETLGGY